MKVKTHLEINYLKIAIELKNARVGRETLGSLGYDRPIGDWRFILKQ